MNIVLRSDRQMASVFLLNIESGFILSTISPSP